MWFRAMQCASIYGIASRMELTDVSTEGHKFNYSIDVAHGSSRKGQETSLGNRYFLCWQCKPFTDHYFITIRNALSGNKLLHKTSFY